MTKQQPPATHDEIVLELRAYLALGMTDEQLVEHLKAEHPKTQARTRRPLIARARAAILADAGAGATWAQACSLERLNDLYQRSLHIQDYKTCLSIEKQLMAVRDAISSRQDAAPDAAGAERDVERDNIAVMWPRARAQ